MNNCGLRYGIDWLCFIYIYIHELDYYNWFWCMGFGIGLVGHWMV